MMVAPWAARRTVENLGRNKLAVPATLLMPLLQDEEARAQVSHATAPSNAAHNYGTYEVDPLWWTPWSALAALPVRSQASIGKTNCLLRWSFWRSFHQALLQPTRPHWPESRPNLTCLEPIGTGSAEYGQLSPKQECSSGLGRPLCRLAALSCACVAGPGGGRGTPHGHHGPDSGGGNLVPGGCLTNRFPPKKSKL
jgi:hypothetical protein